MAEPVELGADLPDLGRQELVVPDHQVAPERAAGRRAGDAQREGALAEIRHGRLVDAADLVDLAGAHQPDGVEDLLGRDPVRGAGLVLRSPAGWPPLRADRRGVGALRLRGREVADAGRGLRRAGRGRSEAEEPESERLQDVAAVGLAVAPGVRNARMMLAIHECLPVAMARLADLPRVFDCASARSTSCGYSLPLRSARGCGLFG
jgi:hypothetical protein